MEIDGKGIFIVACIIGDEIQQFSSRLYTTKKDAAPELIEAHETYKDDVGIDFQIMMIRMFLNLLPA